jgi:glycerol-3-phosphate dehydrogenase (NAD(P)+)
MKKQKVVFIGAGEIGSAVSHLIQSSKAKIENWDKAKNRVKNQKLLSEIVPQADVLFLCIPSWALQFALKDLKPLLSKKTIVISVSKGIEKETELFIDQLLKKSLPKNQPFALLSGPMLAEEFESGQGGAAVVGTNKKRTFNSINNLFLKSNLNLTHEKEIHSVAIAGTLKNIYAISLGIASGLSWGDNRTGWLITESIREMQTITKTLRGKPEVIISQAGLGDFIATGSSKFSSNFSLGIDLAKRTSSKKMSEGKNALPLLLKKLGKKQKDLPILSALNQVLFKKKKSKDVFEKLFTK